MANVRVSRERRRGCGYRKEGGLYLVSDGLATPCPLLPLPLETCPTCGAGIRHSRGWSWVSPRALFAGNPCPTGCEVAGVQEKFCDWIVAERAGLMWVGRSFYETPAEFEREADAMGVSKKIKAVPRGFELGRTWVLLAHVDAVLAPCPGEKCSADLPMTLGQDCEACDGTGWIRAPGVFSAFLPSLVEKVVNEDISNDEVEALKKRGVEPVVVMRDDEQTTLEGAADEIAVAGVAP